MKKFISVMLAAVMVMSFAGCSKSKKSVSFEAVKAKDFIKAIEEAGFEEGGWSDGEYREYEDGYVYGWSDSHDYDYKQKVEGYDKDVNIAYIKFEDEEEAYDYFESIYDYFEDYAEDQDIDGSYDSDFGKDATTGYVLIDGEFDWAGYYHGAWYFADDMVIYAYATKDKDKRIEQVDTIFNELGFTTP